MRQCFGSAHRRTIALQGQGVDESIRCRGNGPNRNRKASTRHRHERQQQGQPAAAAAPGAYAGGNGRPRSGCLPRLRQSAGLPRLHGALCERRGFSPIARATNTAAAARRPRRRSNPPCRNWRGRTAPASPCCHRALRQFPRRCSPWCGPATMCWSPTAPTGRPAISATIFSSVSMSPPPITIHISAARSPTWCSQIHAPFISNCRARSASRSRMSMPSRPRPTPKARWC